MLELTPSQSHISNTGPQDWTYMTHYQHTSAPAAAHPQGQHAPHLMTAGRAGMQAAWPSWCRARAAHPQWFTVLATMMAQAAGSARKACVGRALGAEEAPLPACALTLQEFQACTRLALMTDHIAEQPGRLE